jgi:hypothetical protein
MNGVNRRRSGTQKEPKGDLLSFRAAAKPKMSCLLLFGCAEYFPKPLPPRKTDPESLQFSLEKSNKIVCNVPLYFYKLKEMRKAQGPAYRLGLNC